MKRKFIVKSILAVTALITFGSASVKAQDDDEVKTTEVYGFAMMDAGYNFDQIHPDWFDVVRPTKLPTYKNQYGTNGNFFFSVRQTRFGVKNWFQTSMGTLFTQFEFEMFGTGVDAGQTTIRLRHAYGELGKFGAGQYWSPFMDIDVFPNTVEYWGPNGMAFFRNVQFRFMPIKGDNHKLTIALERPGASADQGDYADRLALDHTVKPRFPLPDLSAEYRHPFKFGYIELAGIVREMKWEDLTPTAQSDVSGDATGWGVNLSTNIKLGQKCTFRGSGTWGEGIQNYMNDAPVDVAIKEKFGTTLNPTGEAIPMVSASGFFDINWNERFSTAIGYSFLDMDNTDGQTGDAFKKGQYAVANLAYYPVKNVMIVGEYQYGTRENKDGAYDASISKVQFSFKYNFSQAFYKKK